MSAMDRGVSVHVAELSRAFLAHRLGVVVTVYIYMDESGIHDSSPAVTIGATWATPEVWGQWGTDWCLKKAPVKVFRSSDCHNREGEFENWDHTLLRRIQTVAIGKKRSEKTLEGNSPDRQ